jgi:hypothetical protein
VATDFKRVMKLKNNQTSRKRGEEGYNPAFKFDLVYDCVISNLNAVTKYDEADNTETRRPGGGMVGTEKLVAVWQAG